MPVGSRGARQAELIGELAARAAIASTIHRCYLSMPASTIGVLLAFGDDACQRLSYAMSMKNIEKGIDRIEQAVKTLA